MTLTETKKQIDDYVQGKKWYYYLPLWLLGLYMFVVLLGFDLHKQMPLIIAPAYSLDFFVHEFAHIFTAWLPPIICAASGSFSELLLGGLLILIAFKTKGYFAALFCSLWFMLACQSAGEYMADARAQSLVGVSLGSILSGGDGSGKHDWHFVFGQLHLLWACVAIGDIVRAIGILVGFAGIVFAAWLMYRMAAAKPVLTVAQEKEIEEVKKVNLKAIDGFTSYPIGFEPKQTTNNKDQNSDFKDPTLR